MSTNSDQSSVNNTNSFIGALLAKDLSGNFGSTRIGNMIIAQQQNNGVGANPQSNILFCIPTNAAINVTTIVAGTDNIGGSFTGIRCLRFVSTAGIVSQVGLSTDPLGFTVLGGWSIAHAPINATVGNCGAVSFGLNRTTTGNLCAFHILVISNLS
jgi:hypothetical protein